MNYWHNTKLKILNFTHCDMDGAAAGIVIKNYFNDVITESINYSAEYTILQKMIKYKDQFDAVIFTDFCPCNLTEIKAFGKQVLPVPYISAPHSDGHPVLFRTTSDKLPHG